MLNAVFLFMAPALRAQTEQTNRQPLRGTQMVLGRSLEKSVAFAKDLKNWQHVTDLGLNTVRICWVDPWFAECNRRHWTAAEGGYLLQRQKRIQSERIETQASQQDSWQHDQ